MSYSDYLKYADRLGIDPYTEKQWSTLSSLHLHMIERDCRRLGIIG